MASIYVHGEDRTRQISDWWIHSNENSEELMLSCRFHSKKKSTWPLHECEIDTTREVSSTLLVKKASAVVRSVEKAVIYGEKYAAVQYSGSTKIYVQKLDGVEFIAPTGMKEGAPFRYFVSVAKARKDSATSSDQSIIAANVARQLQKLPACAQTALHAYCTGSNAARSMDRPLIYPFGVNESQLMAVEKAFSSQISLIEGPPGTGKTQTILNIIANILLRGQTVAILSNNNPAVDNLREKLEKYGLDYLVAALGSKENQNEFFANMPTLPTGDVVPAPAMDQLQLTLAKLKCQLHDHNAVALLTAEIAELTIERRYLVQWQQENDIDAALPLAKYGLSPKKVADLMAYLSHLAGRRIGLRDRVELLFNFKILRTKSIGDEEKQQGFFFALQLHYYDKVLREKEAELSRRRESLKQGNFQSLLNELTTSSMKYLKDTLRKNVVGRQTFDSDSFRRNFDAFLKRFPIIASSTHSIVNSLATGTVLDYVIIDEASQQDIVPGILALGCAKNLIVVGDRKQLVHIPVKTSVTAPADEYDCEKYSLLDSCIGVFKETLPKTLLKEHYRCHPKIIQFCNQQFYDNELIPMTRDGGEEALSLLVTAKGNHTRHNTNLRELESWLAMPSATESAWHGDDGRGFIAPFRAQVTLSGSHLPRDFVRDTVHKFQGRECEEIVFSTVLDKKRDSKVLLRFVDDPRMINVAVSRAKKKFTLVTGDEVFTANKGPIAALVRYVEYYGEKDRVLRAPVVSAFDLLYKEYDESLVRLNTRLRHDDSRFKSEQIVAQLLREALSDDSCRALTFHSQIALNQLASSTNAALTAHEQAFMRNRASCDFVLYFKVGKVPLGVIEVDGGSHDTPEQIKRDVLKNSILAKSSIPLLRLRTVEGRIEERIAQFVGNWASDGSA